MKPSNDEREQDSRERRDICTPDQARDLVAPVLDAGCYTDEPYALIRLLAFLQDRISILGLG